MTKSKTKRAIVRSLAIVLAVLMPLLTTVVAFAEPNSGSGAALVGQKKYDSPDINELTGHGEEPEELSVSAGATYQEKAWYEYVTYSERAICSYRISDNERILFYDPYTYTNALVSDVKFDPNTTKYETMSEYSVSFSTSKTLSACAESTYTNTSATQTSGKDEYGFEVTNGGSTITTYNHDTTVTTEGTVKENTEYKYDKREYETTSNTLCEHIQIASKTGFEASTGISLATIATTEEITVGSTTDIGKTTNHNVQWYQTGIEKTTDYGPGYKTTTTNSGTSTLEDKTTSTTEGWEQLSARVTKTLGSSSSTSTAWSEAESTTVTKTYAATHFSSDGVTPLPWAVVDYSVQMPMKCCYQIMYSGEWITVSTVYCLLTTIQGTCRTWMNNGQAYIEDWGSGEPVLYDEFWSQFMTKDQLVQAYQNKLYPVGGAE